MASRYLNNITINDAYTFPTADGTDGQVITTDGSGTLSFADAAASDAIVLTVKNISGGSLSKGTVVHPSPSASPPSGNVIEVIAADKSAASTMPAIGVLNETLADDGEGECIAFGTVKDIDTSSFSASDPIYVGASGGFTATKPSGTDLIQKIGIVVKVHASNGSIKVFGANRTNDVPAPLYVDIPNGKVGIGDSTPSVSLDINATDAIQMPAGTTAQRPTAAAGMFRYNTTDGKFEGYTTEWGEIGGGGSGTVTIEKDVYTGDGSDTTFDTTTTISSENNVQVYLDGVYQSKDNYTTSGSTVTFSTAPPNGTSIELIHLTSVSASIILDTDTGDGSTTAFTLTNSVSNENNTQVYIDGVYQSKDNYSVSGTTLTFSTAPANGTSIEVVHIKPVNSTDIDCDTATVSGDLTVDTNTLYVDSTNNRVGIGTTSPSRQLTVENSGNAIVSIKSGTTSNSFLLLGDTDADNIGMIKYDNSNNRLEFFANSASAKRLAINSSGNVGIGTDSPAGRLHVYNPSGTSGLWITRSNNTSGVGMHLQSDSSKNRFYSYGDGLTFWNAAAGGTASERMRINSSGSVGIGTTSPSEKLHVNGNIMVEGSSPEITFETGATHYNWQIAAQENVDGGFEIGVGSQDADASNDTFTAKFVVNQSGVVEIKHSGTAAAPALTFDGDTDTGIFRQAANTLGFAVGGSEKMRLEADGDLHVDGDVIAASTTVSSDEKLKENIAPFENALDSLDHLKGVSFDWKKDGTKSAGVIAQDVMKVYPYLVSEVKDLNCDCPSHLTVNYNGLIGVLIEAVKELGDRVKELEK